MEQLLGQFLKRGRKNEKSNLKPLEEPSCLDLELADTQQVDLFSNTNEMQNNNL